MFTTHFPWPFPGRTLKPIVTMVPLLTMVLLISTGSAQAKADIAVMYEEGKAQMRVGDHQQAAATFSKILGEILPHTRNAYAVMHDRAKAYYWQGNLKKAWDDVNTVLRSPEAEGDIRAACLNLRAFIHSKRGRERKALQDFTKSIKMPHDNQPLRARSFADRGITYINMDLPDKAVSDFNQAIRLKRNFAFAYAGRALAHLRADRIERARRDSLKALQLNPDKQTVRMAEGVLKELSIEASGPLNVTVNVNRFGQIFVPVKFSKRGKPHRFLLDTGASYSLVSKNLMAVISRDTTVTQIGHEVVATADGSRHRVTRYRIGNAFLAGLPLGAIEVHVFNSTKNRIINLLGTKSLANIEVHIDNLNGKVRISRKSATN